MRLETGSLEHRISLLEQVRPYSLGPSLPKQLVDVCVAQHTRLCDTTKVEESADKNPP